MRSMVTPRKFLSTKELSKLLDIPEGTLRQWRSSGVGPTWHKLRGGVFAMIWSMWIDSSTRAPVF